MLLFIVLESTKCKTVHAETNNYNDTGDVKNLNLIRFIKVLLATGF